MGKSSRMYKEAYGDETIYITATGNNDYSDVGWVAGKKTILINVAKADDNYIRLPEATTSNLGLHVQIVMGIAAADALRVGFVTTVIQGGALAMGDTNEAVGGAADHGSAIADAADSFLRLEFDLDTAARAGATGGTVLDFWYTGAANVVVYRGHLISEIDAPTLASHFATATILAA